MDGDRIRITNLTGSRDVRAKDIMQFQTITTEPSFRLQPRYAILDRHAPARRSPQLSRRELRRIVADMLG